MLRKEGRTSKAVERALEMVLQVKALQASPMTELKPPVPCQVTGKSQPQKLVLLPPNTLLDVHAYTHKQTNKHMKQQQRSMEFHKQGRKS